MPATFDLTGTYAIAQGADYALSLNLTSAAGSALNLTNYSVASQIRSNHNTPILASFTITTVNSTGVVTMKLSNSVTSGLPPTSGNSTCAYDVFLIDPSGIKTRILAGAVEIIASITQ
jgi:hypothetical protein